MLGAERSCVLLVTHAHTTPVPAPVHHDICTNTHQTHARTHTKHTNAQGLLDLVEMVMAKADPKVTAMYDAKLVSPQLQALGDELRGKFDATKAQVRVGLVGGC